MKISGFTSKLTVVAALTVCLGVTTESKAGDRGRRIAAGVLQGIARGMQQRQQMPQPQYPRYQQPQFQPPQFQQPRYQQPQQIPPRQLQFYVPGQGRIDVRRNPGGGGVGSVVTPNGQLHIMQDRFGNGMGYIQQNGRYVPFHYRSR